MDVTQIPYIKLSGIKKQNDELCLEYKDDVLNHINTIHASAQFALAETKSGEYLLDLFSHLNADVIPVLRESKIKYKKPALKKIIAYANVKEENRIKFEEQFLKKGRASIEVEVSIKDIEDTLTSQATFVWFVQKL